MNLEQAMSALQDALMTVGDSDNEVVALWQVSYRASEVLLAYDRLQREMSRGR